MSTQAAFLLLTRPTLLSQKVLIDLIRQIFTPLFGVPFKKQYTIYSVFQKSSSFSPSEKQGPKVLMKQSYTGEKSCPTPLLPHPKPPIMWKQNRWSRFRRHTRQPRNRSDRYALRRNGCGLLEAISEYISGSDWIKEPTPIPGIPMPGWSIMSPEKWSPISGWMRFILRKRARRTAMVMFTSMIWTAWPDIARAGHFVPCSMTDLMALADVFLPAPHVISAKL